MVASRCWRISVVLGTVIALSAGTVALADTLPGAVPLAPAGAASRYDRTMTLIGGSGDYVAYESAPSTPGGRTAAGNTVLDVLDSSGQVSQVAGPENLENDAVEFAGDILILRPLYNGSSVWDDVANGTSGTVAPAPQATDGLVLGPSDDGWITVDSSNPNGVRLFDTATSGSVTALGAPFSGETSSLYLRVMAGPDGLLAEQFENGHDGDVGRSYMSYSTPGVWTPLAAGTGAAVVFCSSVSASAVGCAAGHMTAPSDDGGEFVETEVLRVPVNGDPVTVTAVSKCPGLPAVDGTATMWETGCGLNATIDRVAAAGGAIHTSTVALLPRTQLVAAQNKVFVAGPAAKAMNALASTSIYSFTDAASAPAVAVAATPSAVTVGSVALSAGRVVWQDDQQTSTHVDTVWQRSVSTNPQDAVELRPETKVSSAAVAELAVSGAETVLQHDASPTSTMSLIGSAGAFTLKAAQLSWGNSTALTSGTLSGDRLVYMHNEAWTLFDLRTGRRSLIVGDHHGKVVGAALWGNTLAYAEHNGSVWSRDLATGAETRVRPALPQDRHVAPAYVFAYGDEVGWDFPEGKGAQAGFRDVAAGTPAVRLPVPDAIAQLTDNGVLYLRCPNSPSALDCIDSPVETGSWWFRAYQGSARRVLAQFPQISVMAIDDGLSVYLTQDGEAGIAPLPDATTVEPRSLGAPIAPTAFVATHHRRWRSYQPYSAPLTTCSVAIRHHRVVIRRLSCSVKEMKTGDVLVRWDGTTTSGHLASAGRYTWTAHLGNTAGAALGPSGQARIPRGSIRLTR